MKKKIVGCLVVLAGLVILGMYVSERQTPAWGQEAARPDYDYESIIKVYETSNGKEYHRVVKVPFVQTLKGALNKYQSAKDDAAKVQAKAEMSALVSDYFDKDMKRREQEIAEIEKRVNNLRTQLEKRKAARNKILELNLQLLESEVDGLGLFDLLSSTDPRRHGIGYPVSMDDGTSITTSTTNSPSTAQRPAGATYSSPAVGDSVNRTNMERAIKADRARAEARASEALERAKKELERVKAESAGPDSDSKTKR